MPGIIVRHRALDSDEIRGLCGHNFTPPSPQLYNKKAYSQATIEYFVYRLFRGPAFTPFDDGDIGRAVRSLLA